MKENFFRETKQSFSHLKKRDLYFRLFLFFFMSRPFFVSLGQFFFTKTLHYSRLLCWVVKKSLFSVFCGGESLQEAFQTAKSLKQREKPNKLHIGMSAEAVVPQQ